MKGRLGRMGLNPIKVFMSIFVFAIALPLLAETDAPATVFVKKVKGAGTFETAIQTTDGGYVSVSRVDDNKYTSYIVRKISNAGKRIWERTLTFQVGAAFGDGFVSIDGISETNDGYVLVGSGPLGGYYDGSSAVLVKLRTDGTVRWSKTFKRPESEAGTMWFDSVSSTADGGFIVSGGFYDFADFQETILVKFASSEEVSWSKKFKETYISFSQPVSDGLIVAGSIPSLEAESADFRVLKLNDSGRIVWKKKLKIEGFDLFRLGSSPDNGVVLAGKSSNSNKLILIGLNAKGEFQWKASYSLNVDSFFVSGLVGTSDLGHVITGTSYNPETGGDRGGFVLRIDAKQNLVFQKAFGLSDTEEQAESVFATPKGGFTVFGSSGLYKPNSPLRLNDILVLSLNSNGVVAGCGFLHQLSVNKVGSPKVTTKNLEIRSPKKISLPAPGTIEIVSVASKSPSSNACP